MQSSAVFSGGVSISQILGCEYRYAYNGMEVDKEVSAAGGKNSYTTQFRQYDPRLGRWKSLDPLEAVYIDISPFSGMGNNPVKFIDKDGLYPVPPYLGGSFRKQGWWNGVPFNYALVDRIEVNSSGNVFSPDESADPSAAVYWGRRNFQRPNTRVSLNMPTHVQNKLVRKINRGTFQPRDANNPIQEIQNSVYLNTTLTTRFTGLQVGQVIVVQKTNALGVRLPDEVIEITPDMIDENGNITVTHTIQTTQTYVDNPKDDNAQNAAGRTTAQQNQITTVDYYVLGTGNVDQNGQPVRENVKVKSKVSVSARNTGRVNPHRNGQARRRSRGGGASSI